MTSAATALVEIPEILPLRPIIVIENGKAIQGELQQLFESDGYAVEMANRGAEGLELSGDVTPSAFVLHFQMAENSPRRLFNQLRRASPYVPIIVLGASSSVMERVLFLELGADDYIVMPFNRRELLARIRAAIRRVEGGSGKFFAFGEVHVSFRKMEVRREGMVVPFTALEFKLLKFMIHNPERVLSRQELLNEVWGYQNYPTTRTVDNQILKLRQKLEPCPSHPVHFCTFHRVGYKFVPVPSQFR